MKQEFRVLAGRRTVTLRLTRDSVAAGDDVDAPHEREIETYSFLDPAALINHVCPGYLPSVAGVGHSWSCVLNGDLIAKVTVEGVLPKVREMNYGSENHLHFSYTSAPY